MSVIVYTLEPEAIVNPHVNIINRVMALTKQDIIEGISGLVVKSVVAIDGPRVRFTADAY